LKAGRKLDVNQLMASLTEKDTASAEDIMREAVVKAQEYFNQMYK